MNKKYLSEINDVYFINEKLKSYDENLKIFYNKKAKRYEVHNNNIRNSFVISFGKYPDEGLIQKFFITNKSNISKTLKLIEEKNSELETSKNNLVCDNSNQKIKEIITFATKKGDGNLSESQIRNIIS